MKILRTFGTSLVVLLSSATPAFAQEAPTDPLAKTPVAKFWFQDNWFINLTFVGTSILLVLAFCVIYYFKVLRPKFRGRPVE